MGSPFDRNAPKPENDRKKVAVVVALTAGLALVLGYNWLHNVPRGAEGSALQGGMGEGGGVDPAAAPALPESAAQALAGLADDPTAKLLRGVGEPGQAMDEAPGNPFVLSGKWRAVLVKPEQPRVTMPLVETGHGAPAVAAVYSAEQIKLQGIFRDTQRSYAIINGTMVTPGMVLAGMRVVEVQEDRVICQPVGAGESARFEVVLKPKAK